MLNSTVASTRPEKHGLIWYTYTHETRSPWSWKTKIRSEHPRPLFFKQIREELSKAYTSIHNDSLASPVPWSPYNNYSDLSRPCGIAWPAACLPPCYNKRARETGFLPSLIARRKLRQNGGLEACRSRPQHRHQREVWWEAADQPRSAALGRRNRGREGSLCALTEGGRGRGLGNWERKKKGQRVEPLIYGPANQNVVRRERGSEM